MMKTIFKTIILGIAVFALSTAAAQDTATNINRVKKEQPTIALGAEITQDTVGKKHHRGLKQHLIIPKGEWQLGAQLSHVSLASDNSEFMLLINGLNANASITKIAPFFAYSYHNNRSIGMRLQYTSASGCINSAELDLLGNLNKNIEDEVSANLTSLQASVYHRSYLGLDNKGRIGVFADLALSYANRKNAFKFDNSASNQYARTHQVKLSLHPGIVVFAMNNISTHLSMGIGGVSYNHTELKDGGKVIGTRDYSQAKFKLDIMDISVGLSIHL